ncbi:uncharacterized protein [Montipora capricornis]|uniref:uncharacterized protein n=1 Tax=Montipora capricornis TaxID=246305 RepID=UPI0035F1650C
MADDDDKNGRKVNSDRGSRTPHWRETCIGIWSRSTKGHHVNDGEYDKICNGISVIRIHGKPTDSSNLKLSKTRGLQIIITIDRTENDAPTPHKPHDHTYISVDREETDDNEQKAQDFDTEAQKDQVPNLTKRVMDIMLMKKTNLERNVEHYKNEGVKLTDIWDGVYNTCSKCYETTARLISYCHPVEKINQMCGFVANRIKNARKWADDNENKKNK